jgi:hypothetical protein
MTHPDSEQPILNLPQLHYLELENNGSPKSADAGDLDEDLDINQITDVKILTSTVTKNHHSIKHFEKTNKIGRSILNSPNRVKV